MATKTDTPPTSKFRDTYNKLSAELDGKKTSWMNCINMLWVIAILIPIIIGLLLFFVNPSFLQKKEGGKQVRNMKKFWIWTISVTLVLWGLLFLYTYCAGYDKVSSMFCWGGKK